MRALEKMSWDEEEEGRDDRNVQLKDVNIADAGCCGESVLARAEAECFLHGPRTEAMCW